MGGSSLPTRPPWGPDPRRRVLPGVLEPEGRVLLSPQCSDTGRGYQFPLPRLPGAPGPERVVSSHPPLLMGLTSGGRYGGLLALPPLFLPFFFFPFGPPQPLLPPAPLALRVPPTAGPPPGRQQPPNSSDTRESIRRCRQPPARPLPPRHRHRHHRRRRLPYCHRRVRPARGERGGAPRRPRPHPTLARGRVRNSRGAPREIESSNVGPPLNELPDALQLPGGIAAQGPRRGFGA